MIVKKKENGKCCLLSKKIIRCIPLSRIEEENNVFFSLLFDFKKEKKINKLLQTIVPTIQKL